MAAGVTLVALTGAAFGAELSSRAYPPLLAAGGAGDSFTPLVSADGRYVVFVSEAGNLTGNDHNQLLDVFVRDRESRTTVLLSAHAAGSPPGRGHASAIAISADANWIAYEMTQLASTPLPGFQGLQMTNTTGFLIDRAAGQRRSVGIADGLPLPFVSGDPPETNWLTYARAAATALQFSDDGRRLFFQTPGQPHLSSASSPFHLLVELDLMSGSTNLHCTAVSPDAVPTAELRGVRPSADGERAAFFTTANNLHPLDGWQNGSRYDVFVYDHIANSNILVSIAADGTRGGTADSESPDLSGDGRYVVFTSLATNLVATDTNHNADVFLRDLTLETTILVSSNLAGFTTPASGASGAPAISGDGRWIAFFSNASDLVSDDPNGAAGDVFLRDRETGAVTRISNHPGWRGRLATTAPSPQLAADGSFVLYQSPGSGLFHYERASGANRLLTADVAADSPSMSPDGRFVVFSSQSVPGLIGGTDAHRQVYLFDRQLNSIELISERATGIPVVSANNASRFEAGVVATTDALLLARSYATDLGLRADDRKLRLWNLASTSVPLAIDLGKIGSIPIEVAKVANLTASANGRWLAFDYDEPALAESQTNSGWHVVLHDRQTGVNRVLNHTTAEFDGPHFPTIAPDGSRTLWRPSAASLAQYENTSATLTYLVTGWGETGAEEAPLATTDNRFVLFRYRGSAIPGFSDTPIPNWHLLRYDVHEHQLAQVDPLDLHSSVGGVARTRPWRTDSSLPHVIFEGVDQLNVTNVYLIGNVVATNAFNPFINNSNDIILGFESTVPRTGLEDTNNASDVFVRRTFRSAGDVVSLVSVNLSGTGAGNGRSRLLGLNPDGQFVLFHSWASDLVTNDTNQLGDLFLRDLRTQTTLMLTIGQSHAMAEGNTAARAMFNHGGSKVIFESYARNFVTGDFNETRDVFTATLAAPDTDGDGMPDGWELTWFGTLDQDGTADSDGDGVLDRDEFVAGTSPINDTSVLAALPIQSGSGGEPVILWAAVPGRTYRVQYKDDFNVASWAELPGDVLADSSTGRKLDETAAHWSQRFYRVLVLP